jgi:hypothetical protein
MDKIHVWIGYTSKTKEEFGEYFKINEEDKNKGIGASQFDKDIGINWYDDDLIGVYKSDTADNLEQTIDEIPTSNETLEAIKNRCKELGVDKANAMFYYTDAEIIIEDNEKLFNGIQYLGLFDNE